MKQRLVGAAVLMALGIIFIPIFLAPRESVDTETDALRIKRSETTGEFSSKVMPIDDEVVERTLRQGAEIPELVERASVSTQDVPAGGDGGQIENALDASTSLSQAHAEVAAEQPAMTAWIVQAGSFSSEENAEKLAAQLRSKAYTAYIENMPGEKASYRVRIGPMLSKARAEKTAAALKKSLDIEGLILKYQ